LSMSSPRSIPLVVSMVVASAAFVPAVLPADASAAVAPTATAAAAGSVDALDRDSVIRGFNDTWLPTLNVPFSWTGSVDQCIPGSPSGEVRAAVLTQINYVRDQAGVGPVSLAGTPNTVAQAAALIMDANDANSHQPPTSWKCWSQDGAAGAATSQLAVNVDPMQGVAGLISDPGSNNSATGHRKWLLDGAINVMGAGVTPGATAINTAGFGNGDDDGHDWPMVTWPTAGYFPEGILPESGRWSATVRDSRSLANATASVGRAGYDSVSVPVEFRSDTHLVFSPSGIVRPSQTGGDVTFEVRISGVQDYDGNPVPDILYTTTLVAAGGIDATWTTRPSIPGTPVAGQTIGIRPGAYTPVLAGDQITYTWYSRGQIIGTGMTVTPTMAP
jgi:uncharacterized protein YkwD